MSKPVEFSEFYKLLNAVKEGQIEKKVLLEKMLNEYEASENADSPLHELGQIFLHKGVVELFKYADSEDLAYIGSLDTKSWQELAKKNRGELPPCLANAMIIYGKNEGISKMISKKWKTSKREIDKNIMQMARYITEGIIDAIE